MIKTELCNYLIENGLVVPYQVIRHSYSNHRLREDWGGEMALSTSVQHSIHDAIV